MSDHVRNLIAETRPSRKSDPQWIADIHRKLASLSLEAGDTAPWGSMLAPFWAVLLTGRVLSLSHPVVPTSRPMPLTGPDWEIPVTAAEVLP